MYAIGQENKYTRYYKQFFKWKIIIVIESNIEKCSGFFKYTLYFSKESKVIYKEEPQTLYASKTRCIDAAYKHVENFVEKTLKYKE